jgi:anti-anti-sigma factor
MTPLPSESVGGEDQLRIDLRTASDRVVIELHGELDLLGTPLLEREIERADVDSRGILVLDLQGLEFVDSAGLRVILATHERARRHGQEFALTKGPEQVQRLLRIAGLDDHLRMIDAPDDVLV